MATFKTTYLLLSACAILFLVEGCTCPDGCIQNGACCYWFSRDKGNFGYARSVCEHFKSGLAIISNKDEDDFLRQYALTNGGAEFYVIDGTDLAEEGTWAWRGGKKMAYTNWGPGQPDNYRSHEHCLGLWKKEGYQWNDGNCEDNHNYICEK